MIKNHAWTLTLSALLSTGLAGCGMFGGGDDTGTNATEPSLQVRFQAETGRRSGHLTVTKLDVWVAEIVFDAETDERSISVSETQNLKYNALSGEPSSDPVSITLAAGTYFSPYLGVELWDDGSEPALVLEGTLDDVPIRFVFNSGEVFEAESERLVVAEGTSYPVTFTLEPQAWFNGIAGSSLALGADGVAEISETSNAEVFDLVADALDETTDGRFPGGDQGGEGEEGDSGELSDSGW